MNERIKELAEQAGEYVNEVYTPPVRSKTPGKIWEDGHIDWHIQFNQKFAELIVRECIQVVDGMADPEEDSDRYVWALHNASEKIREHFGVEE
jgi:hypothetical protein